MLNIPKMLGVPVPGTHNRYEAGFPAVRCPCASGQSRKTRALSETGMFSLACVK